MPWRIGPSAVSTWRRAFITPPWIMDCRSCTFFWKAATLLLERFLLLRPNVGGEDRALLRKCLLLLLQEVFLFGLELQLRQSGQALTCRTMSCPTLERRRIAWRSTTGILIRQGWGHRARLPPDVA